MFIDSPDFSRRKVLNAYNASSPTPQPEQYHYGLQRSLLARHVAERLNSHNEDELILQKFRKEAQQLKRQRWLSKKAKLPPPVLQPIIAVKSHSQELAKQNQEPLYPRLTPVTSVVIESHREKQFSKERNERNNDAARLQRLLHSKQKEIRRKDRKLERSRQIIESMEQKINDLQQQKRLISSKEQLQTQKINALIEQMNYRIAANRAIFQEELARLKLQQQFRKPVVSSLPKLPYDDIPPPVSINRRKKEATRAESDRFLAGPSVFYELPKIAETTGKLNISLLSKNSKRKLERFNPQDY